MQGKPYRPNVVRIGSEEAPLAQRARDVWVDGLIRQYTHLHPEAHGQRMSQHIRAATQLSRTIAEIVTRLAETTDQVCLTDTFSSPFLCRDMEPRDGTSRLQWPLIAKTNRRLKYTNSLRLHA